MGDTNLHLDVATNPDATKFQSVVDSHGLVQHVSTSTHTAGHLLDVFITRSDTSVHTLDVEPPALSDHAFITASVDLQLNHAESVGGVRRRQWRAFDYDTFCDDLRSSVLLRDPPTDAAGLFTCYHDTLQSLVDKHAPFADVKLRAHPNAPWYNLECQMVKVRTRQLERNYRHDKSEANRSAWRQQSRIQRFTLQQRYVHYWTDAISSNIGDSKALWSKVSALLKTPQIAQPSTHNADDFAVHFRSKVDAIRASTSSAPPPTIGHRQCNK
jgi:hypothetical protein